MHIAEGFLPPFWAIFWWVVALPFIIWGVFSTGKIFKKNPEYSDLPITGWVCKEVKGIYDDEAEGKVSCTSDKECKNKFDYSRPKLKPQSNHCCYNHCALSGE